MAAFVIVARLLAEPALSSFSRALLSLGPMALAPTVVTVRFTGGAVGGAMLAATGGTRMARRLLRLGTSRLGRG